MADKYYRLVTFLVNICPQPLRELLLQYFRTDPTRAATFSTIDAYLKSRKTQLSLLRKRKVLRREQWELLFPSATGKVADETSWDTTLVIILLEELFIYQLQPVEQDAMRQIRRIRNQIQHMAETTIDDADFDNMWTILEGATIDLAKQIQPTPIYAGTIQEYIDVTKTNNMPNLGDTLRHFYEDIIMKMKSDMEDMKELLKEVSEKTNVIKECQTILHESSVKLVGPSGEKVKRIKTVDHILTRLKNNFITTMKEDLSENYLNPPEVADINTKLRDAHHVVVTGFDGSRYLEVALAAITRMNYNQDRCVELRNASDWRHIDPEEVDFVLCREPFGDFTFDEGKTKGMAYIFNSMLQTAKASKRNKSLDIIIVAERAILQQVKAYRGHDLLGEEVQLNQHTTEFEPADLTGTNENCDSDFDQATRNQIEFSAAYLKRYTDANLPPTKDIDEAKAILQRNKVLVLTGPRKCGKTTLALTLASKYQTNQFLVINKPDDMKLIRIGRICTVLVEDFAGKFHYDEVQTQAWLKEFDLLYSVVRSGKLNVILTCEEKFLLKCKEESESHPILQNPVVLKPLKRIIKQESIYERVTTDTTILAEESCSVHTQTINLQSLTPVFSRVKEIQNRIVSKPEVHYSSCSLQAFCQHPDGSFLSLYAINPWASLENSIIVQRISSDLEHIGYLDIDILVHVDIDNDFDICCTDAGEVVVASDNNIYLFRISNGRLRHINSTSLEYNILGGVSFYKGQIYANTYENIIIILDANLNINKTINSIIRSDESFIVSSSQTVPCSLHSYFTVNYRRNLIYCENTKLKQIKYLRQEDFNPVCICPATDDSVYVLGKQEERARILHVNSDMNVLLDLSDLSIETNTDILRGEMIFDRVKNRLIFHGRRKFSLTVIEME